MTDRWSGRKVQAASAVVAGWLAAGPLPCTLCGKPVQLEDRWVLGHKEPRALRPDLMWTVSNWGADHKECSDASGSRWRCRARSRKPCALVQFFPGKRSSQSECILRR